MAADTKIVLDANFFGTGVPTWTSDSVHLYLSKDDRNVSNDDE